MKDILLSIEEVDINLNSTEAGSGLKSLVEFKSHCLCLNFDNTKDLFLFLNLIQPESLKISMAVTKDDTEQTSALKYKIPFKLHHFRKKLYFPVTRLSGDELDRDYPPFFIHFASESQAKTFCSLFSKFRVNDRPVFSFVDQKYRETAKCSSMKSIEKSLGPVRILNDATKLISHACFVGAQLACDKKNVISLSGFAKASLATVSADVIESNPLYSEDIAKQAEDCYAQFCLKEAIERAGKNDRLLGIRRFIAETQNEHKASEKGQVILRFPGKGKIVPDKLLFTDRLNYRSSYIEQKTVHLQLFELQAFCMVLGVGLTIYSNKDDRVGETLYEGDPMFHIEQSEKFWRPVIVDSFGRRGYINVAKTPNSGPASLYRLCKLNGIIESDSDRIGYLPNYKESEDVFSVSIAFFNQPFQSSQDFKDACRFRRIPPGDYLSVQFANIREKAFFEAAVPPISISCNLQVFHDKNLKHYHPNMKIPNYYSPVRHRTTLLFPMIKFVDQGGNARFYLYFRSKNDLDLFNRYFSVAKIIGRKSEDLWHQVDNDYIAKLAEREPGCRAKFSSEITREYLQNGKVSFTVSSEDSFFLAGQSPDQDKSFVPESSSITVMVKRNPLPDSALTAKMPNASSGEGASSPAVDSSKFFHSVADSQQNQKRRGSESPPFSRSKKPCSRGI